MDYPLISAEDPESELIKDLRGRICREVSGGGYFLLALSGGSSPTELYRKMAESDIPWESLVILQVDEREVPPGHEDHNFTMIRQLLIDRVPIPESRIVPVDTSTDHSLDPGGGTGTAGKPKDIGRAYAAAVEATLERYGKDDLDAAILGLGTDGHTASVFPEEEDSLARRETAYLSSSPRHPHSRVTLSLPFLSRTGALYLLAKGEKKRAMLQRLLSPSSAGGGTTSGNGLATGKEPAEIPAALLPKNRLRIYTDLESSVLLGNNSR